MKDMPFKLSSTMEDYLEAIYFLKKENGFARVKEIAATLKVKSPTVNSAIKFLSDKGLVSHEKYGYIGLTPLGERAAAQVQKKHDILFKFLTEFLLLDEAVAQKEACCIEHAISHQTYLHLTKFFEFLKEGFDGKKPRFLQNFESYLKTGSQKKCICAKKNSK